MAIITQTDADKAGISPVRVEVTGATNNVYGIRLGSVYIIMGNGDPNGELTAPIGSWFINTNDGTIKRNTNGGTTWSAFNS